MPIRRWDLTAAAVSLWGAAVVAIAAHAYLYPHAHSVFPIYATAARDWWAGRALYGDPASDYRYSPLFAVAVTPFALLPDRWGGVLWKVFNCAFYAIGLWAWGRQVLPTRLTPTGLAALFLLALPMSLMSMHNGQANLAMLGGMLLALSAVALNRWNAAAGWLALATFIKGYPLAFALLLAGCYPGPFVIRCAAALGSGLVLPFAFQSSAFAGTQTGNWLKSLHDIAATRPEKYRSIDQLWRVFHRPLSPNLYAALSVVAGGAVLGLCLLHRRRSPERRELLTRMFMLFAAWVVLFGPTTEEATYVVVAPAIAWALVDAFARPAARGIRLLLVTSLLLMGPFATDMFGSAARIFATQHGSLPLGALLFLGYLLAQAGRIRRERQVPHGPPGRPTSGSGETHSEGNRLAFRE